ncbi:MAG: FitA-like ribbon-helix-helix domain-containing protein [Humibacter sp.]
MPVTITIRSVPDAVRDTLAARAKRRGQSMQEYLVGALRDLADKPTVDEWMAEVREHAAKRPRAGWSSQELVDLIHEAREERIDHLAAVLERRDEPAEYGET